MATPFSRWLKAILGRFRPGGERLVWRKEPSNPVLPAPPSGFLSDGSIIFDQGIYKAVFSGEFEPSNNGNSLLMYTSTDRRHWTPLANGKGGIIAQGTPARAYETPHFQRLASGEYIILFDEYDPAIEANTGDVALLTSPDGVNFTYHGKVLLKGTGADLDAAGIAEVTAVEHEGVLFMYYTGWTGTPPAYTGFYVLKAVSRDWGRTWVKTGRLDPVGNIGLQHTCAVKFATDDFRIYYGIDGSADGKVGLWEARCSTPHGTFKEQPEMLFGLGDQAWEGAGDNGGFPAVVRDPDGAVWMLYTGIQGFTFSQGLAELVRG